MKKLTMETNFVENKVDEIGLSWYNSYYWKYQYKLSKEYIIPYLRQIGFEPLGKSICEVGSAEGGVLFAFAELGASNCLATDIVQSRLDAGEKIAREFNLQIVFKFHNILDDEIPDEWKETFDLVILRDVIEHLEEPKKALLNIKNMLRTNGLLYVTFPPYYSPFGGHQHQTNNFFSKVPYLHWLPNPLFKLFLFRGREADVQEVLRLKKIKLTIKKFLKVIEEVGLKVHRSEFFLIRPVYKYKFRMEPKKLPNFMKFHIFKEIFATEASFLLLKG